MALLTSIPITSNVDVIEDWQRTLTATSHEEEVSIRSATQSSDDRSQDQEMTLAEASAHSGLAQGTLRVLIHRNRMTGRKRGRDWFVTLSSLETYLLSRDARGRRPLNPKAERR